MNDFENKIIGEFNNFMKVLIKNATKDFYKMNSVKISRMVSFNEPIKLEASLSIEDNGAFSFDKYININELPNYFENTALINSINKLSKTEKKVIEFIINNLDDVEISAQLNINIRTLQNKKSLIKKKISTSLGGKKHERNLK